MSTVKILNNSKRGFHGPKSTGEPKTFRFAPGVNDVPISYLEGLPEKNQAFLSSARFEILSDAAPEPAQLPAPPAPAVEEPRGYRKLPKDTDAALDAVKACDEGPLLNAWFQLETARPVVSDAILERLKDLDRK